MNFRVIFVFCGPKNIKIVYSVNRNSQSSKICCLVLFLTKFAPIKTNDMNICMTEIAFSFLIRTLVYKILVFSYSCMPSTQDTVVNGGLLVCLEVRVMTS